MEKSKFKITFLIILRALHHHLLPLLLTDKKSNRAWCRTSSPLILQWSLAVLWYLTLTRFFLLSIPSRTSPFSVLDLKDAFFSIPLSPQSQNSFAFTWTGPDLSTQLTWLSYPRDSWIAHIYWPGSSFWPLPDSPKLKLIQYVDGILL